METTNVYLLAHADYDTHEILGVYATEDAAKRERERLIGCADFTTKELYVEVYPIYANGEHWDAEDRQFV